MNPNSVTFSARGHAKAWLGRAIVVIFEIKCMFFLEGKWNRLNSSATQIWIKTGFMGLLQRGNATYMQATFALSDALIENSSQIDQPPKSYAGIMRTNH